MSCPKPLSRPLDLGPWRRTASIRRPDARRRRAVRRNHLPGLMVRAESRACYELQRSETVALVHDDPKTVPERRFRRGVGFCRPLSGACPRRCPSALSILARCVTLCGGSGGAERPGGSYRMTSRPEKPSTSRPRDGLPPGFSKPWCTALEPCCVWQRQRLRAHSRQTRQSHAALYT